MRSIVRRDSGRGYQAFLTDRRRVALGIGAPHATSDNGAGVQVERMLEDFVGQDASNRLSS